MSFLRAARAALAGKNCLPRILVAVAVILAGLSLSCGNSTHSNTGPNHNAYVSLPARGSVLLLHINGATGAISKGAETPQVQDTTPRGLALLPSKKFLYAVNSSTHANSISIFSVASDGTLTLSGPPTPASGSGPNAAVIDPSGKYLLVTNTFGDPKNVAGSVSVYSIDAGSGALSEVPNSPFFANTGPSEILITPSGKFVYVTNPGIGTVTAFTFSNGVLTEVKPGSPFTSGAGASGLVVDGSERFLYVANPLASNLPLQTNTGNISGFNIQPDGPNAGALTPILGSPFTATVGNNPTAITVDPSGRFVYAVTPGSSFSIWCFSIGPTNGLLTAATNSPFSLGAGELFALFDPSGNYFYIGSQSGNGIPGYTYNSSTGALTVISGSPFSTGTAPGKMALSE
jgi:6-phosphogluconolactonase (cycloisomerase 2 family)